MDDLKFSRRDSLGLAALVGAAAAIPTMAEAATKGAGGKQKVPFITKIDLKDPYWTRDTYARIDADIDPTKEIFAQFRDISHVGAAQDGSEQLVSRLSR